MRARLVALTVAVAAAVAGCSAEPPAPAPTATAGADVAGPSSYAVATVTPAKVQAAIDALTPQAEELMAQTGLPGMAIAVTVDGETRYAQGFGVRELGKPDPVDTGTVFQVASVSKPIGATVIAGAVGQGLVRWDTRLRRHLPRFALSDAWVTRHVTVADVYSHRSGLYDHAGDDLEWLGYRRGQILHRLREVPLAPFRSTYAYTNYGLTAGGVAVAKAAGTSWRKLSQQVLYDPLGMTSTTSSYRAWLRDPDRAIGHRPVDGTWIVSPEQQDADPEAPAGGVASSVDDMVRWMQLVLGDGTYDGRRIVDGDALADAASAHTVISTQPKPMQDRAAYYGYGFNVSDGPGGNVVVSHSGAFATVGSYVGMLPVADVGIVVLTNGQATGVAETIGQSFLETVQLGAPSRDWWELYHAAFEHLMGPFGTLTGRTPPAHPAAARPLTSYEGRYHNDYFGTAVVTARNGSLQLSLGPGGRSWRLRHWNGDLFAFEVGSDEVAAGSLSKARFRGDRLILEYFDQHGMGTFRR